MKKIFKVSIGVAALIIYGEMMYTVGEAVMLKMCLEDILNFELLETTAHMLKTPEKVGIKGLKALKCKFLGLLVNT